MSDTYEVDGSLEQYPKGVFVLYQGEVVIIGAGTLTIYRKGDYIYPKDVEVYTENNIRKARFRTEVG